MIAVSKGKLRSFGTVNVSLLLLVPTSTVLNQMCEK
jgi:hypothetical protein